VNGGASGRYFEEWEAGTSFTTSARTVARADIDQFIALSGDTNRLHTDDAFARANGFRERVAHGALIIGLATGLAWQTGLLTDTVAAFRAIEDWKFTRPVYSGDAIHVEGTVAETRPLPRLRCGLVRFTLRVVNQDGQTVAGGSLSLLFRSRPA